jgi:hypothetical protein
MSPKSSLALLLAFSAGAAALPAAIHAQAVSVNGGSIQGTITDPTGAAVPNATITIKGTDTGLTKTLTSDSAGFYSVGPLNPGNYSVTISQAGFQTTTVNTVVRTGTATAGNFKLTVGNTSQTVEVTADALQVNTDQTSVSDVITRQQIDALPINGRNFLDVAQVEPGVILESGETFDPTKAGYSAISVSGVSGRTTRILLDGQDITDETVGTTIVNVTTGAIDEFQLNRSTQDVSGEVTSTGQVLVSTRSGTNALHGQLFYNFQDHRVGFARTTNGFDAPFQRNNFGGEVGGPIIKDKLFFFADSERIKQDNLGAASTSPTFAAIQAQYPSIPSPFRDTFSVGRLDYQAPKGIHMFARVFYEANSAFSNFGDLYSLYNTRNNVPGINGGADFTTGKFTHSLRIGYEKFHNLLGDGTAGLTSIYNPLPNVTLLDGTDGFYAGPNFLAPQGTFQSDKQFRYDGTWTKGSHTVKFGANLNYILGGGFAAFYGASLYTVFGPASLLPNGNSGDPINGYSAELYVLGNGNGSFTEKPGFGLPGGGVHDWRSAAYVADTWKATPALTLVAGLRWSVDTDRANQDLPTPLCSSVAPSLQFAGCTGNTPLFDQFQQGLGKKTPQPYHNFGPQLGFVFSPGKQKTSFQGGIGIFYDSDIFNNTTNARTSVIQANGPYFNYTTVCGGTNTVTLPDGTQVNSVNGVSLATICGESIAQAAPQIQVLKAQYQAASAGNGPNPAYIGGGGGLRSAGIYGGQYTNPYSIQFNGGFQHELFKGAILSANYVHTATIKVPLVIDVNHVGAARFLNATAAKAAVANTLAYCNAATVEAAAAPNGCAPTPTVNNPTPGVFAADITTFASFGLDSSNQYTGGYPVSFTGQTPAAFAGANPNLGLGEFILPVGRSGYDALQLVYRQQVAHPVPGIVSGNFQASYSLSRSVNPVAGSNNSDQFFNSLPYDFDNPNEYIGRSALDHTNELSFGGGVAIKYGLSVNVIGHFFSAPPTTLTLDNTSGAAGEIFRTDITGDGTTGDVMPGTEPGDYMHRIKGAGLNRLINNYNATEAGQPTPAGLALINNGVLSQTQLTLLNAVQQQIATAPTTPLNNPAFRTFDASASYPIRFTRFREGLSLEPGVAIYNVTNMANFSHFAGTLANISTAGGTVGMTNNFLNGPNTPLVQNGLRTQRGSGTFDQGAPRTTEFQLKLNF